MFCWILLVDPISGPLSIHSSFWYLCYFLDSYSLSLYISLTDKCLIIIFKDNKYVLLIFQVIIMELQSLQKSQQQHQSEEPIQ